MKVIGIPASDGKNHVIDESTGQIAIIGFQRIDHSRQFLPDGRSQRIILVELFYDSNYSDEWFFSTSGKLLYNHVNALRGGFVLKLYKEVTKSPGIDINVFLNMITSCWSGYKLGYISKTTFDE